MNHQQVFSGAFPDEERLARDITARAAKYAPVAVSADELVEYLGEHTQVVDLRLVAPQITVEISRD